MPICQNAICQNAYLSKCLSVKMPICQNAKMPICQNADQPKCLLAKRFSTKRRQAKFLFFKGERKKVWIFRFKRVLYRSSTCIVVIALTFLNLDSSGRRAVRHRDKTRVQMSARIFPHLKLKFLLFMGPTLGFDTKQRNSFLIKFGVFFPKKQDSDNIIHS